MTVRLIHAPTHYFDLMEAAPDPLVFSDDPAEPKDFIHFFTMDADELSAYLPRLKKELKPAGYIWVSWPKKASQVQTTVTGDSIRRWALACGLVDVKVCAVDETWSGLKLVIPLESR